MEIRSLAFRTDLALLRLAGSTVEDRGQYVAVRTQANPTFRWGNFDLLAVPPAADEVADVLARYDADLPDGDFRTFGVDGTTDQAAALAPMLEAGLRIDAATVMTATSVHAPPRPNRSVQCRTLATDDDWAQRVELSVAVDAADPDGSEGAGYRTFAERRADADRALCEAGHGTWWGAFAGDRLVASMGLVDAGSGLARFQSVETHPDHRGQGIAGTLVHRVAAHGFDEVGAHTLVMVADPDYLAIRVYRSVGFTDTETQTQLEQRSR
ncbi:GNAT family N-acetyltransferase [Nocardioides sp. TF02-7]|uniref:GNAT family N-acetyltransferase n=1 Tax=Nocardioides sp. TF02-7 TaxID=2917724 RepID=UPI001F064C1B|nr:GNAT family N-acetyltransferase [Nocardioides sp. TF02-7]UMG92425.1 GNAT family N-acetyltransferase [Nocardioides sp. TF02-7]